MRRVLIVEDDAVVTNIYKRKFELSGYDVEIAHDGVVGLQKVVEFRPDIVQLDLQMPKMDGVELIKQIRARPDCANLPIVVLSSLYKQDSAKEAWKAGATRCVSKMECTPHLALEIIGQVLAASGPPAQQQPQFYVPAARLHQGPGSPPPPQVYAPQPQQPYPPQAYLPQPQQPYPPQAAPPPQPYPPQAAPQNFYPAPPLAAPVSAPLPDYVAPPIPLDPPTPTSLPLAPPSNTGGETSEGADVRKEFLTRAPEILTKFRVHVNGLFKAKGVMEQLPHLRASNEVIHSLTSLSAATGFNRVSHLCSALEVLFKELYAKPARVTASSLRTIAHAADAIGGLCQDASEGLEGTPQSGLILAVDDEPISRRVLSSALAKASLKTISLDDPLLALRVLQENQFDLIFLDGGMPGMSGFELCKQIRTLPHNKSTPVIFVTSLTDFDSRAQSSISGGNDLIAKPFLMIELAVKALTYLLKPKVATGGPQAPSVPPKSDAATTGLFGASQGS